MKKILLTTAILLATSLYTTSVKADDEECQDLTTVRDQPCSKYGKEGTIEYEDGDYSKMDYSWDIYMNRYDYSLYDKKNRQVLQAFYMVDQWWISEVSYDDSDAVIASNFTTYEDPDDEDTYTYQRHTYENENKDKKQIVTTNEYSEYKDGVLQTSTKATLQDDGTYEYVKYTLEDGLTREYSCPFYYYTKNCSLTGTYKYTYDSDGDLLSKISYDANENIISTENYALKIYTVEQAYAATSKGNHNTFSIRFK